MHLIEARYTRKVSNKNPKCARWLEEYEHEELAVLVGVPHGTELTVETTADDLAEVDALRASINDLLLQHPDPGQRFPAAPQADPKPALGSTSESETSTKARTALGRLRARSGLMKWLENVNGHPDLSSAEKVQLYHCGKGRASDLLAEGAITEQEHDELAELVLLCLGEKEVPF